MEVFVLKTLKRLRKESPRRYKDLRLACDELIAALSEKERVSGFQNEDNDADQYFEPLEMACETRQPRLMEIALDALHFLIEHGYLRGRKKIDIIQEDADGEADAEGKTQLGTLMDLIVDTIAKCSDETDEGVQLQVIKALLTAITSLHCEVHEASLLLSVRACFHIHLISKNNINKTTAKAALTQMLSVINQRMEINEKQRNLSNSSGSEDNNGATVAAEMADPAVSPTNGADGGSNAKAGTEEPTGVTTDPGGGGGAGGASSNGNMVFPSVYHKDAYLLFRALCKLSMKGLSEESQWAQSDAIPLQNKILSLELILGILLNSGPAFRAGDKFIYAVRTYLCVSLLSNCTSHNAQVTGLSLQIFSVLLQNFRDHLKNELEVFVSSIFLRMLESENSTYDHKFRVLEVFHNICQDPKGQVELFINYDCDIDAINLFSRIVAAFAKIAKNPSLSFASRGSMPVDFISSGSKKVQLEEQHVRMMGLEGLVAIIQSIEVSAGLAVESGQVKGSIVASDSAAVQSPQQMLPEEGSGKVSVGEITPEISSTNLAAETEGIIDAAAIDAAAAAGNGINKNGIAEVEGGDGKQIVEVFDKKQKFKEELENGILKFNLSPKKGLAYLVELGHLKMTPEAVAAFLHQYEDRLDKTVMGDFLGREREYMNGFCIKVLHEYVEALDFTDMPFDLAIRYFLRGFRLPGEAQKIDRIMENFAERYYLQNRDNFASADMAFILAFSTIMLQTNLHNPAIKEDKRMTKEQFIKQNKGISADGELSDDLLSEIYDRIAAEPISINSEEKSAPKKVKAQDQSSFVMFQTTNDRRRKDAFSHERKEMVRAGEAMIKHNMKRTSSVFVRNSAMSDEAYVKPMFEIVWPPMIGVLSALLETYDDPDIIHLCLSSFRHSILLACRLDVAVARNTFINALVKFTTLETVREMRPKNVLCIKLLINVALSEGDYLEGSWSQVLQSISQLARLQLFASGSHTDDMFFSEASTSSAGSDVSRYFRRGTSARGSVYDKGSPSVSSDAITKLFMGPSRAEAARLIEETNAEMIVRDVDPVVVDRLFLNSVHLSGDSVKHFVRSLCEVSLLELNAGSTMNSLRGKESTTDTAAPRIFSLQKMVEVADCNMFSRSRMDWAAMWDLLAKHFTIVGLHENQAVSMYAIDSLKQLSIKFLQKDELSNFNFQRLFLKPFEVIISRTKSYEIKDLILNCLDIMIRACANNIHSGWRSIFAIFTVAASQEIPEIATTAFVITEQLMNDRFDLLIFDFVELMNCLVAFASSNHTTLALKSLQFLSRCADHLAEGTVGPAIDAQHAASDQMGLSWEKSKPVDKVGEDGSVFRLWWPLLLGLSTSVSDSRLKVRKKALDTLQGVLRQHGHIFSPQTWAVIFKGVLFPMVDSARTDTTQQPRSSWPTENPGASKNMLSWIGTMAAQVLDVLVELYLMNRVKDLVVPLLPDMLLMLEGCICQETESLAKISTAALTSLLLSLGQDAGGHSDQLPPIKPQHIDLICSKVVKMVAGNLCLDFGDAGGVSLHFEQIPENLKQELTACPVAGRRRLRGGSVQGYKHTASFIRMEDLSGPGTVLQTPYGEGTVAEVLPSGEGKLDLPTRLRIEMVGWGASLYSNDLFTDKVVASQRSNNGNATASSSAKANADFERMVNPPPMSREQNWSQLTQAVMTCMVTSLDLLALVRDLLTSAAYEWQLKHYSSYLTALELSHWHAYCFNENIPLRLQLQQRGFMNRGNTGLGSDSLSGSLSVSLPHLLEQEVLSMEQILFTVFRLFCYAKHAPQAVGDEAGLSRAQEFSEFAEPLIERMSSITLIRYLSLEESALRRLGANSMGYSGSHGSKGRGTGHAAEKGGTAAAVAGSDDDDYATSSSDEDEAFGPQGDHGGSVVNMNEFLTKRHEAYKSPVLIVLEGMMDFTHEQFQRNLSWIVPLLSRLIICEDLEVRLCVRQIYQSFVNFLLIQ